MSYQNKIKHKKSTSKYGKDVSSSLQEPLVANYKQNDPREFEKMCLQIETNI